MITLFDILQWIGVLVGCVAGCRAGYNIAGTLGAVLGILIGVVVGWVIGRLPFALILRSLHKSLKKATSSELRSRLDREYFISHKIIAELISRGEPVESFRGIVASQLYSKSADVRRFGYGNAKVWFPDLLPPTKRS